MTLLISEPLTFNQLPSPVCLHFFLVQNWSCFWIISLRIEVSVPLPTRRWHVTKESRRQEPHKKKIDSLGANRKNSISRQWKRKCLSIYVYGSGLVVVSSFFLSTPKNNTNQNLFVQLWHFFHNILLHW